MVKRFLLILCLVFVPFVSFAQISDGDIIGVDSADSSISRSGDSLDIGIGVPGYPDNLFDWCDPYSSETSHRCNCSGSTCEGFHLVYSGVSTVLSTTIFSSYSFPSWDSFGLTCNGDFFYEYGDVAHLTSPTSFNSDVQFHCDGDLGIVTDGSVTARALVQYLPYDTRLVATSTSDVPSYQDWLVVWSFGFFFLSLIVWGLFYSTFFRKKI